MPKRTPQKKTRFTSPLRGHSFTRALLLVAILLTTLTSCGWFQSGDEPVPTALEIGYRRKFNHDRTEHAHAPFSEAVQKAGSVTVATLEHAEDTGEGYAIYTFTVRESLYNPDGDTVLHLYEGFPEKASEGAPIPSQSVSHPIADPEAPALPEDAGATTFTPAYKPGLTYLLVLSRATDVYYPHPYFHNFNGIFIAADEAGEMVQAISADGAENLLRKKETKKDFQTFPGAIAHVQALLNQETGWKKGTWRFSGPEILSEDPAVLAAQSPYIARIRVVETVFENRYVKEVKCTITKPYKGIFGLGSAPDPTETTASSAGENATPPTPLILPGNKVITVLFPAGLTVSRGDEWLAFLREEQEYRITAKAGMIPVSDEHTHARYLAAVETEMQIVPTPEPVMPTPTPTPRVWTILDAYKDLPGRNPDVRGWVRQEGTIIDYPVLQGEDNDWYLSHDIDGKKLVAGSIVLDFRVDIQNIGRNTPLYGHNMKRGHMFHSLVNYKTEKYFKAHPTIRFDTLYDEMEWEIVGVYVVDSSYNYVITMDFEDDAAYRAFLDDITERTMYPLKEPLTLEDKILTMVTCSYEFDGAKTVIQAKLINPEPRAAE